MYAYELRGSGDTTGGDNVFATERIWLVAGTSDRDQAIGFLFGEAPQTAEGLAMFPNEIKGEQQGPDWWVFTIPYKPLEIESEDPDNPDEGGDENAVSEFSVTADSQHITQAISTANFGGGNEAAAIAAANVIGLTKDSIEGVDIVVPKLELVVPKNWNTASVPVGYHKALGGLCGKVNAAPYIIDGAQYEGGELLFLGANGKRGTLKYPIEYHFLYSPNRQNIVITAGPPQIMVASKKGHEYLWVSYKKNSAVSKLIEVPDIAFVAKVYEEAAFQPVLGF